MLKIYKNSNLAAKIAKQRFFTFSNSFTPRSSAYFTMKRFCSSQKPKPPDSLGTKSRKLTQQEEDTNFISLCSRVKEDLNLNYININSIKQSFITFLSSGSFGEQQSKLIEILHLLSQYPKFTLENHQLLLLYKTVCFNVHLKSVEYLNKVFLFVLVADPNISQSPIYHQFIKFYLQVPSEEWKAKYQIDFDNLSVLSALKQFIARIAQRGFSSRSPSYYRNLNVFNPTEVLAHLALRSDTSDSLMIKKINYTIFMDIKTFYESEMKENLYHWKKVEVMQKFDYNFMLVLSRQMPKIEHQNSYLRQLYMKLYLTLPEEDEDLHQLYEKQAQLSDLKKKFFRLKVKNIVFLYELAEMHIKRLDHLSLDQIQENIGVVIEFLQQVQHNFQQLTQSFPNNIHQIDFPLQEEFKIVRLLQKIHQDNSTVYSVLVQNIIKKCSPFNFQFHFPQFVKLLKMPEIRHSMIKIIQTPNQLSLLNLNHLNALSQLIQIGNNLNFNSTLFSSILFALLSTDFTVIGGQQLLSMLIIYSKYQLLKANHVYFEAQTHVNSENLRIFIMRYLADHHSEFKIKDFEAILSALLELSEDVCYDFDDKDGNYPKPLFEEMNSYMKKVQILFREEILQKLKERREKSILWEGEKNKRYS